MSLDFVNIWRTVIRWITGLPEIASNLTRKKVRVILLSTEEILLVNSVCDFIFQFCFYFSRLGCMEQLMAGTVDLGVFKAEDLFLALQLSTFNQSAEDLVITNEFRTYSTCKWIVSHTSEIHAVHVPIRHSNIEVTLSVEYLQGSMNLIWWHWYQIVPMLKLIR
jgi:hypothetical protein